MENQTYGYIRVSSKDQCEDRQLIAMREAGVPKKNIHMDKQSGKDFERAGYQRMVKKLKPGDTLFVKSIDRLGRNYDEILEQWRIITKEKQAAIVVLDMPLLDTRQRQDLTGTLIADIVLQLLSYVAQTEREFLRQRQAEGIAAAKEKGVRFGRPPLELPSEYDQVYELWYTGELSARAAARSLGISHQTFLKWTEKYGRRSILLRPAFLLHFGGEYGTISGLDDSIMCISEIFGLWSQKYTLVTSFLFLMVFLLNGGGKMAISLFPHNESAYFAAVQMLSETGRAAIIHPTGTGKSFIGFKLCEDHPDQRICWLSPSEYIFRTQVENLADSGADFPDNVTFYTYARLMLMDEAEMEAIQPDYLILDEFHRCGAAAWGDGVQRLIALYPEAKLLGLSATNIRYLDNQRDMADELFDGNVASVMTLGEAIVRGILNAPIYVLSVFAYQKDYDRLKSRVRRAKSGAVRDEASRYLEALRRALEQADGLDVIFDKHMTDRHGKYLVFCANREHMREMMSHVPEWFQKIDSEPHVYSAYSDDPAASKAFQDFKADNSDHLKLLFCIDMLNEGVHVENVSGVILFRPTVSPIIYKQQIGRALSASKTKDPIIFDVVNNIENLYSIGTIEQEIQAAVSYYRFYGDSTEIVNERFQLIDELRDARELFERLNDTLVASWDLMYQYAKQYYERNGDLNVPRRYKTEDGYALGAWLQTQRKVYAGEQYGVLGEDRVEKLNAIGMRWGSYLDESWERYYQAAAAYYQAHGDLKVNANEVTETGLALGSWIARLRTYKKSCIRTAYLSPDRIQALEQIGMVWDVPDYLWEENFNAAMRYYREHGDLDVPNTYVAPNGLRLGAWIRKMRSLRNGTNEELTQDKIERLNSIGMIWEPKHRRSWAKGYEEAKQYHAEHGNLNVPASYVSPSGFKLGRWLDAKRSKGKTNLLPEQREQLDALGFVWQKPDPWEVRYALAKAYYEEHGNLNLPAQYKADGIWLHKWLNEQKNIFIGKRPGKSLTQEQIQRLEAIGMDWSNCSHRQWSAAWKEGYQDAKAFFEANGHLNVSEKYKGSSGKYLSLWLNRQRAMKKDGKLSAEQIRLLDAIGMVWENDDPWEVGYKHAEQFFKENGHLELSNQFVCEDGYRLGKWIANQRARHNHPSNYRALTDDQIRRLESLHIVWRPKESSWQIGFTHAKQYLETTLGKQWKSTYVSPDGYKTGAWIRVQMRKWEQGGMKQERVAALRNIGLL